MNLDLGLVLSHWVNAELDPFILASKGCGKIWLLTLSLSLSHILSLCPPHIYICMYICTCIHTHICIYVCVWMVCFQIFKWLLKLHRKTQSQFLNTFLKRVSYVRIFEWPVLTRWQSRWINVVPLKWNQSKSRKISWDRYSLILPDVFYFRKVWVWWFQINL